MDAQQWEADAQDKQQRVAALEQEVAKAQQELQQQIASYQVCACVWVWVSVCVDNVFIKHGNAGGEWDVSFALSQ